jgi:hypothetical protein
MPLATPLPKAGLPTKLPTQPAKPHWRQTGRPKTGQVLLFRYSVILVEQLLRGELPQNEPAKVCLGVIPYVWRLAKETVLDLANHEHLTAPIAATNFKN